MENPLDGFMLIFLTKTTMTQIEQIIEKLGKYTTTISFTHEYVYTWAVECRIDRHNKMPVMALRDTQENALNGALNLLEKFAEFEKSNGRIFVPELSNQPCDGGYHHQTIGNTKLSYKRINDKFYLYSINTITDDGFVVLDTPVPINKTYKFIKHTDKGDLYEWDDIQVLSGTAGLAYVKDGFVIASKTLRRA